MKQCIVCNKDEEETTEEITKDKSTSFTFCKSCFSKVETNYMDTVEAIDNIDNHFAEWLRSIADTIDNHEEENETSFRNHMNQFYG